MRAAVLREWGTPLVTGNAADPVFGTGEAIVDIVATNLPSYAAEVFSSKRIIPWCCLLFPVPAAVAAYVRSARMQRPLQLEVGSIASA